jgi:hypothetical protein
MSMRFGPASSHYAWGMNRAVICIHNDTAVTPAAERGKRRGFVGLRDLASELALPVA